jgi:hypothetical protein
MPTGLTKEVFEKLLRWLDPDRDKAGQKYEKIRLRLIRLLRCWHSCDPEDLADKSINVVASKIDWLLENYQGDPALYFYGVSKKVYKENLPKPLPAPPPLPDTTEIEKKCSCLDHCLKRELSELERQLLFRYHEKEKREKILVRKQIALEFGISLNALRIRVYHLHVRLRPCIEDCLRHLLER